MTIEKFAKEHNRSISTVLNWIYQKMIPGASVDNDFVPSSAREPYTGTRPKTANGIYTSIMNASNNRKYVCHNTYGLSQAEYNGYVDRLIEAKLLTKRVEDGVEYLDVTLEIKKYTDEYVLKCIEVAFRGFSEGVTKSFTNKAS